jgi:hypothetical protein
LERSVMSDLVWVDILIVDDRPGNLTALEAGR